MNKMAQPNKMAFEPKIYHFNGSNAVTITDWWLKLTFYYIYIHNIKKLGFCSKKQLQNFSFSKPWIKLLAFILQTRAHTQQNAHSTCNHACTHTRIVQPHTTRKHTCTQSTLRLQIFPKITRASAQQNAHSTFHYSYRHTHNTYAHTHNTCAHTYTALYTQSKLRLQQFPKITRARTWQSAHRTYHNSCTQTHTTLARIHAQHYAHNPRYSYKYFWK